MLLEPSSDGPWWAGGSWRNVLREWAGSAGWGVGLSVFVWRCSWMLCFWNTRKDKHIHNKNIKAETENSELVCKHSPLESKLKAPWAQPRNSWGDGVIPNCTDTLWRSYHHYLVLKSYNTFTPDLKISKTNRISGILFTVAVQCHLFKLGLLQWGGCGQILWRVLRVDPSPFQGHLLEGTPSHQSAMVPAADRAPLWGFATWVSGWVSTVQLQQLHVGNSSSI